MKIYQAEIQIAEIFARIARNVLYSGHIRRAFFERIIQLATAELNKLDETPEL